MSIFLMVEHDFMLLINMSALFFPLKFFHFSSINLENLLRHFASRNCTTFMNHIFITFLRTICFIQNDLTISNYRKTASTQLQLKQHAQKVPRPQTTSA